MEAPPELTEEDLRRGRRFALWLRVGIYGTLVVLAVLVLGARAQGEEDHARWVHGRTSQNEPISLLADEDGKVQNYDAAYRMTCDFASVLYDFVDPGGRSIFAQRGEVMTFTEVDHFVHAQGRARRTIRLEIRATDDALVGRLSADDVWHGRGTCTAGPVTFRVPR